MAREIREQTLLKLDEQKRSGRNGKEDKTMLRVVQWNNYRPTLEKREFWKDGSQWKPGKCKGFNIDDLHLVAENWEEIVELLQGEEEEEEEEERPRRARSSNRRASGKPSKKKSKTKSKTRGKRRPVLTHNDDEGDDYNSDDDDDDNDDDNDFDDYDD